MENEQKREIYDFGLLKVRKLKLDKAQSNIISFAEKAQNTNRYDRMSNEEIIRICKGNDLDRIRELSIWFAKTNGMYGRAVRYIADINKFDYLLYPDIALDSELEDSDNEKILKQFDKVLSFFDNSSIQLMCRKWSEKVCTEGVYYGYICDDVTDRLVVQDLPAKYCRSRFFYKGYPLVEFNMKYFQDITHDPKTREKVLNLFPPEFREQWKKYEKNKLQPEEQGDTSGWIPLKPERAFKLSFNEWDRPPFLSGIPALVELSEIQDLEKEKLLQQIQKVLVQQFDLDKNGQIPFQMPELERLNQNAIELVGDAVGVSVLSTFGKVQIEDIGAEKGLQSINNIDTAENNVFNNWGLSTNLFNTSGNLALEKSSIVDEAFAKPLILQFNEVFNRFISWRFNKKSLSFRMKMLFTTIFNSKELASQYKDLTKLGYSRFFPASAMGHSQKEITSLAKLEQQIMQLDAYMLPPFSSNTMSSETWTQIKEQQEKIISGKDSAPAQSADTKSNPNSDSDNKGGRPSLPNDQKTDKTLANEAAKG